MLTLMDGQIASLTAEVAACKQAESSSSGSSAAPKKKGAEAEIARRKTLLYVPADCKNPFPERPKNLESDMPQIFPMYGDKTHDALSKKTASSMKYEYAVLAPAFSYMHGSLAFVTDTVDGLDAEAFTPDEIYEWVKRVGNSIHGVYSLLCNRFTDCVYQGTEDLVTDTILKEYIEEFEKGKNKASLYANMKNAALAETETSRYPEGSEEEERGVTPIQRSYSGSLVESRCDGFEDPPHGSTTHVSRVFLVKKGEKWRLVFDFKWLDSFCIKSRAPRQRERVRRVLARRGLSRNEKKGQRERQLIEHLGLEVDLKDRLFRVTKKPSGEAVTSRVVFRADDQAKLGREDEADSASTPQSGVVAPSAGDEPVERRPDVSVAMQREHISSMEDVLSVVLLKEKGRRHHQTSSIVHRYIDPTAVPNEYMKHFCGWMAPYSSCG
ncbi:hypothetical protein CYMTET_6920 [Cymbomonas tetramitiformis]|uniref:Uncharacterized protein n=1 Tax=Cymbomonas tetramitiformis TaxID=36881 RepID=A0AAE0GW93_9CHLO|nr:hypothetical protein CYMTET_6920 [Cymbomonas tetramitiformis]